MNLHALANDAELEHLARYLWEEWHHTTQYRVQNGILECLTERTDTWQDYHDPDSSLKTAKTNNWQVRGRRIP